MPRYVILEHDHPVVHWDLMLEEGERLRTWRLAAHPAIGQAIAATCIHYHRLKYLDYQGPVSGNRGGVVRWDFGTYAVEEETQDALSFSLDGNKLHGRACLARVCDEEWEFRFGSA